MVNGMSKGIETYPYAGRRCKDLTGKRLGNYVIVGYAGKTGNSQEYWVRECLLCGAQSCSRRSDLKKLCGLSCITQECIEVLDCRLQHRKITKNMMRQYLYRTKDNLLSC
jgi:hypothetical protein